MMDALQNLAPEERGTVILMTSDGRAISNVAGESQNWMVTQTDAPSSLPDPCREIIANGGTPPPGCFKTTGGGGTGGTVGGGTTGGTTGTSGGTSSGGSTGTTSGTTGGTSSGTTGSTTGTSGGSTGGSSTGGTTGKCEMPVSALAATPACAKCAGEYEPLILNQDSGGPGGAYRRVATEFTDWDFISGTAGLPDPEPFEMPPNPPGQGPKPKTFSGPHVYLGLNGVWTGVIGNRPSQTYGGSIEGGFKCDGEAPADESAPYRWWKPYMAINGSGLKKPFQIQPDPKGSSPRKFKSGNCPCYLTIAGPGMVKFVFVHKLKTFAIIAKYSPLEDVAKGLAPALGAFQINQGGKYGVKRMFTIGQLQPDFRDGSQACGLNWSAVKISQIAYLGDGLFGFAWGVPFSASYVHEASVVPSSASLNGYFTGPSVIDPDVGPFSTIPNSDWTYETVSFNLSQYWTLVHPAARR